MLARDEAAAAAAFAGAVARIKETFQPKTTADNLSIILSNAPDRDARAFAEPLLDAVLACIPKEETWSHTAAKVEHLMVRYRIRLCSQWRVPMTYVDWKIKGPKIGGCSCDYGCPCEFNGRPTLDNLCEGMEGMLIEEGYFGDVRLDGLKIGARFRWPGAVHEGGGTIQGFIDKNASEAQVNALFKILSGEEQEPTTIFNIYGATITTELEPIFADIVFECDIRARSGRFAVDGVVEFIAEPIKNPVTGLDHFAQIVLPNGFEFRKAEMASARFTSRGGGMEMERDKRYAALFYAAYGPHGLIPDETDAAMAAVA